MASYKILFLFLFFSFLNFATTQAQYSYNPNYLTSDCSDDKTNAGSAFQLNLKALMSSLSSNAVSDTKGFYNTSIIKENPSDSVFGLFMCRGDASLQLCQLCVQTATQRLSTKCTLSIEAVIWYDMCMVRYSNNSLIFSTMATFPSLYRTNSPSISNQESFTPLLFSTMNKTADLTASIGRDKKFATREANISEIQRLYSLAQCTPDLSPRNCRTCLSELIDKLPSCCEGKQGGIVLCPSCIIRYELYPFYLSTILSNRSTPAYVPASKFSKADSRFSEDPTYLHRNCSTDVNADPSFKRYLNNLFFYMSSNATSGKKAAYYYNTEDTVYGLFMCRGDLSSRLCQQCVLNATHRISSECNSSQEAIIWYSHCMLRYSNAYFFHSVDKSPTFQMLNATTTISGHIPEQEFFTFMLSNALASFVKAAWESNERYATKSLKLNDLQTLHTLAQCTQDLSNDDCKECLEEIIGEIPWSRLGSVGGRVLYPSCNLRFELFQFYRSGDELAQSSSPGKRKGHLPIMILVIVPTIVSAILFFLGYYLVKRKIRKSVKNILKENFGHESVTLEPLQFNLAVIQAATNNFSNENRIGKGGFGEVYKGILLDGQQIAAKRLSKSSKQGANEFKNEVLLIAKLQHKNLVAFIGFCLEDQEKILIYEYVPNKSLDYFLFDSQRAKMLSWLDRYNIIRGIARGIHYLHELSRLKVIHRDLKPSNVLLDENMIPKISDFGLARIVEINQDQGSTNRIVGTYGYMPPEYAMFGRFSEKSDVFSFGVMILEVIIGKKNSNSYESHSVADGLLNNVWRQWRDQTLLSILDPSIKENFSENEVIKCLQIGLLCVQLNPEARPTMAEVLSYFSSCSIEIPSPQEPAFYAHDRMDSNVVAQESSSSQSINGSTLCSVNEMSISQFLPR